MEETHGMMVFIGIFIFVIVLTFTAYFTNIFTSTTLTALSAVPSAFNSVNSILYSPYYPHGLNATLFGGANELAIIMTFFALGLDVLMSWYNPDPGMGIVNIILIFITPVLWLLLITGAAPILTTLNQLNTMGTGSEIAVNFYLSVYFIMIVEFSIGLSTVANFRHPMDGGNDNGVFYDSGDIRSTDSIR